MQRQQRTIQNEIQMSGMGLHTGCDVNITMKPAPVDAGIQFKRVDLPQQPLILANVNSLVVNTDVYRCTTIGEGDAVVYTVEHLMSVLCGLGIDNLLIELDAQEVPGGDGSGKDFVDALIESRIVTQDAPARHYTVKNPISIHENGATIFLIPSDKFEISYTLDYDHPVLRSQFIHFEINEESFINEIAPCRTFCVEDEVKELQQKGLGRGANYQNTLVVGEKGVVENQTLFPDEFARHKVLDLIGDLSLLGMPIKGHIFAIKSGHTLNLKLLREIVKEKKKNDSNIYKTIDISNKKELNIYEIMKVLPHRYPFLLVDRIIEIEKGKRAVGYKNVTVNEPFFQGHFPTRAVMPGVLMVEAMAQVTGIAILSGGQHKGKIAFFMAIDKVKFRKIVVPGDQLVMSVEITKERSRFCQAKGIARVQDEVVAEAEMMFSFVEADLLNP
ncbi:MAG: UDP-3-O-acyl-N-acetylglucosamine deacetylase [Candidatus Omnitrophica bacterium]|nr:UDP-3-O-acyl-N-acetylglucosamine deacetylase [Candidatus Omnitrophota bacterium]